MPYLGKSPQHGNYSKLDDFSGDFDGSDATHAVASNGTAITPVRPEALIISINGVIQEPTTDYTVSGTNITFTTAPTAGDNFFGVAMGEQLAIGTPSDATVTSAKLSGNLVTPGTLDVNGQELILDADADTTITADTDDTIDIKIAGADDFQFTANTFTALSGSTVSIPSGGTLAVASGGTLSVASGATFANSVVDSITAGTTQTQGGATALTGIINRITASGTNGDVVALPTAVAGLTCIVINGDSAQTIDVFPASGDKIQGGSSNAVDPTSIAAGTIREYYCIDAAEWLRNIPVGTVLQRVVINTTTGTNSTSTTEAATALTATISMLDAGSIVQVTAMGPWAVSRNSGEPTNMQGFLRLWESAVTSGTQLAEERIGYTYGLASQPPFAVAGGGFAAKVLNTPGDKAATTYVLGILTSVGSACLAQFNAGSLQATMLLEEIAT